MFPLYDINDTRQKHHPVTTIIILVNLVVFAYQLSLFSSQVRLDEFITHYGVINSRLLENVDSSQLLTLFTSMFLHGGLFHLLGNMWFLWIFGDNIEDQVGSFTFLLFYLFCGISANIISLSAAPDRIVPAIGASGAISGILGAYVVMHPEAKIVSTHIIFGWLKTMTVPAYLFLGAWFALQLISGWSAFLDPMAQGGVDWWAHIGGFIGGALLAACVPRLGQIRAKPTTLETPSLPMQLFTLAIWSAIFASILTWQVQLHYCRHPKPLFIVASTRIDEKLRDAFKQKSGWSGTNKCFSIAEPDSPTIWLFGNSRIIIPANKQGRKKSPATGATEVSIGNAAGWQIRNPHAPMQFFWSTSQKRPTAFVNSFAAGTQFEPTSGTIFGGKLYVFGHDVSTTDPYPTSTIRLLCVKNPTQKPDKWKISTIPLPAAAQELGLGKACLTDEDFLYVYGTVPCKHRNSLVVARLPGIDIGSPTAKWQYCSKHAGQNGNWSEDSKEAVILVTGLPDDLSVQAINKLGFIATYMSPDDCQITLLQATKPYGPWSRPVKAFNCRTEKDSSKPFKAINHPSLATQNGELVVSYFKDIKSGKNKQIPVFVHILLKDRLASKSNKSLEYTPNIHF